MCRKALRLHTERLIHCSRVSEAVAKAQPNSSGNQRTSACAVYAWHHFHNTGKLKLLTLKMVAKCFCLFVFTPVAAYWSESLVFVCFHSKQNMQQYKKNPLYNKVVKTDLPEQWCWNATETVFCGGLTVITYQIVQFLVQFCCENNCIDDEMIRKWSAASNCCHRLSSFAKICSGWKRFSFLGINDLFYLLLLPLFPSLYGFCVLSVLAPPTYFCLAFVFSTFFCAP